LTTGRSCADDADPQANGGRGWTRGLGGGSDDGIWDPPPLCVGSDSSAERRSLSRARSTRVPGEAGWDPDDWLAHAARRIRTCNQGIQVAPVFPRGLDYLTLPTRGRGGPRTTRGRPGARRRGLWLGLTPLVSEPSWPPMPDQAWLRIAVPRAGTARGLGFPQFTRIASGGRPPAPPLVDESPALPLS
jgi:hypothetical protein